MAHSIEGMARQHHVSPSELLRRLVAEGLARLGRDAELQEQMVEVQNLRVKVADLQDREAQAERRSHDLERQYEKLQSEVKATQEQLEREKAKNQKSSKPGQWAMIVARAPHLHGELHRAVEAAQAGKVLSNSVPALTSLRLEAGSWPAALERAQYAATVLGVAW